jgi:hypothetical protein
LPAVRPYKEGTVFGHLAAAECEEQFQDPTRSLINNERKSLTIALAMHSERAITHKKILR